MNNILNTQEAFAAIQKGKQVLCRYAGNGTLPADKDFMTLDQVPASVFCQPHYEFCIKIEMLEVAGISFTKPCLLDEMKEGQQVFIVEFSKNAIVSGQYMFGNTHLDGLISNGVVQRDLANAKSHLKAFQTAIGMDIEPFITDCDPIFTSFDKSNDVPSSETLKTKVVETPPAVIDFKPKDKRLTKKQTEAKLKAQEIEVHKDVVISNIGFCTDPEDVHEQCRSLDKYGFNNDQLIAIDTAKLAKLDALAEEKAAALKQTAPLLKPEIKEEESKYQENLTTLKQRVDESKTIKEVNAVIKYTNSWSAEQREALQAHMKNRLEELENIEIKQEPSMIVKILNAADLTELDALEIDVSNLDPMIQPRMMQYVDQRRAELQDNLK